MYQLAWPHRLLQPYISEYWMVQVPPGKNFSLKVHGYVDIKSDLVFNCGTGYERQTPLSQEILKSSNLDVARKFPIHILQAGRVNILEGRFLPGGFSAMIPRIIRYIINYVLEVA